MAYITDTALCLRVTDFSETSQVVVVFTQSHGLVSLLAKGAKRPNSKGSSKFSGPLDLLALGEALFVAPKSGGELGALYGWQLMDQRNNMRRNLAAYYAGCIAADMTLALLHPLDPHGALFADMEATISRLSISGGQRLLLAYAKSALIESGYQPQFANCVICQAAIIPEFSVRYSPGAGGVLCQACFGGAGENKGRSREVAGRIALGLDRLPRPTQIQISPAGRAADPVAMLAAMHLMLFHIESIISRPLRTRSLLALAFAGVPDRVPSAG